MEKQGPFNESAVLAALDIRIISDQRFSKADVPQKIPSIYTLSDQDGLTHQLCWRVPATVRQYKYDPILRTIAVASPEDFLLNSMWDVTKVGDHYDHSLSKQRLRIANYKMGNATGLESMGSKRLLPSTNPKKKDVSV